MSEVTTDSEATAEVATPSSQIDLTTLDDKNLSRYRHPNETRAFRAIVAGMVALFAVLWIARPYLGDLLSFIPLPFVRFLDHWLHPTRLGLVLFCLILVMAIMDIVGQSTRAWQLVAQAVEVNPTTFPQLSPIVDDLRKRFDLPQTRVYISRDAPIKGYTIGVREPYAIVFSSMSVGSLTADEFKFVLGREMGSIKLGHTRMATLLGNVRMSLPQPLSFLLKIRSTLFSTYHHAQELSCDRIGVVATRDVKPALSTLIKQNIGAIRGAKIDLTTLAPQSEEMQRGVSGKALRTAMLLNPQPWAVARLYELVKWAGEPPAAPAAPAAPPQPTPAASAAAAAKSAAAAAASAAEAAASAAAAAAAAALITGVAVEDASQVSPQGAEAPPENASEQAPGPESTGSAAQAAPTAATDAPSTSAAPAQPSAVSVAPADAAPAHGVRPAEASPAAAATTSGEAPLTAPTSAAAPVAAGAAVTVQTNGPAPAAAETASEAGATVSDTDRAERRSPDNASSAAPTTLPPSAERPGA